MLNGAGSVQHAGETLLISHPESGALFTEYSRGGYAQRSIGRLRATGFEDDRDLHIAMNAGLPLVDPTGGFYYVFITGRPMFRKYSATGTLVFERHIEGREIDVLLESQPTQWPRRRVQDREVPLVTPVVRAARVSPSRRAVGVAGRAVHLRLQHRRRQDPHRAVQCGRHHQPDQPVLHPRRAAAGDARVLRVRSAVGHKAQKDEISHKEHKVH